MRSVLVYFRISGILAPRAYFLWGLYKELSDDRNNYAEFVAQLGPEELSQDQYVQIVRETLEYNVPKARSLLYYMQIGFNEAYLHYGGRSYPNNRQRRVDISRWIGL